MTIEEALQTEQLEERQEVAFLEHGAIASRLNRRLGIYVEEHDLGEVFDSRTTFRFTGTPAKREPDVAFVKKERLPSNLRMEADFAPDLAVEVVSKNDEIFELSEKILQYQQSGVSLIWIIQPVLKTVEVFEAGKKPLLLTADDELDGGSVIPGFRLKISNLFR